MSSKNITKQRYKDQSYKRRIDKMQKKTDVGY